MSKTHHAHDSTAAESVTRMLAANPAAVDETTTGGEGPPAASG
jgi:hypothetical protein